MSTPRDGGAGDRQDDGLDGLIHVEMAYEHATRAMRRVAEAAGLLAAGKADVRTSLESAHAHLRAVEQQLHVGLRAMWDRWTREQAAELDRLPPRLPQIEAGPGDAA